MNSSHYRTPSNNFLTFWSEDKSDSIPNPIYCDSHYSCLHRHVELFIYNPITLYALHVVSYFLILLGQYFHVVPHLPSSAQLQIPLFSLYAVWLNSFKISLISPTFLSFSSCWCPPDPSFGVRFIRKSKIKIIFGFFALTQQLQISAPELFSVFSSPKCFLEKQTVVFSPIQTARTLLTSLLIPFIPA